MPLDILKDLIAIPSVNPMGQTRTGSDFFEGRMTEYLIEFFKRRKIKYERMEVAGNRHNVVCRLDGEINAPTVLIDAHQDTVPVDNMTIDPFDPVIKGDRIHGRGACDVKGGMAAVLKALERIAQQSSPARFPTVIFACTCDEEFDELGVNDMVRCFQDETRQSEILDARPDFAIVVEPTELNVVAAHRGATRWKIRTVGKAAHSSEPSDGINAIYRMAEVVQSLEKFADHLDKHAKKHPLCGGPSLSVGRIEGGISVNIVPEACTIEIDRRAIPGEDGLAVMHEIESYLRAQLDYDFEMIPPWTIGQPLSDEANGELSARLLRNIQSVFPKSKITGAAYGTHASRYSAAGIPSVVFGPGAIQQAHTNDEWLEIPQLEMASEIFYRFLANYLES